MNKAIFQDTGGFPLETETLNNMQDAYNIFNALGEMAGNKTIIKGCEVVGAEVSDGLVYLDGELFEFRGAQAQAKVIIKQDIVSVPFGNGDVKETYFNRYVTFGTGADAILWSEFKTLDPLLVLMNRIDVVEKKASVFQAGGGMVLWNKPATDIPAGWAEVVDWRGRMPVGMDSAQTEFAAQGQEGGAKEKTLSVDEMPEHDHGVQGYAGVQGVDTNSHIDAPTNGDSHTRTTKEGNGVSFSIMNPYRVVMFIEYVG